MLQTSEDRTPMGSAEGVYLLAENFPARVFSFAFVTS
jgi:hypothetical protein